MNRVREVGRDQAGQSVVAIALALPVGLTVLAGLVVAVLGPALPDLVKLFALLR